MFHSILPGNYIKLKILGIKPRGKKKYFYKVESKRSYFSCSGQTQGEQLQYLTQHQQNKEK